MAKKFPLPAHGFNPFADLIGVQFSRAESGASECALNVRADLLNPNHLLHGGVMYSMADTGMGGALFSCLDEGENCATVEIKMNYLKPVKDGALTCATRVIQRGKTLATLESEIRNNEQLVAIALGTYAIFKLNR
ncbi:MAG: PaaI family thioesterase [Chloroflexi bacterium]|nr:PaaI family thioesterase [Chloroflexota bacterium]